MMSMAHNSADTELTLQANDLRLRVSSYGASLRGLWRERPDGQQETIISGYSGAQAKVGGQGDVLIPFPGRVRGGRYVFEQQSYQMALNDKDGPNAIHGFLRQAAWEIVEQSPRGASFAATIQPEQYPGYPFALHATVAYLLDEQGLSCRFTLHNPGDRPAPVAAGFHPYFTVGSERVDADLLHLPMESMLELEQLIPTGRILPLDNSAYDFRQPRPIGDTRLNTCYLNPLRDPDGLLRLRLSAAERDRAVTIWLDQSFNYVVVFSGDGLPAAHARRALAIEPMTCAADAFNHPEWGLIKLAPGQSVSGSWGVIPDDRGRRA
jgi:aldose 1-epimerase